MCFLLLKERFKNKFSVVLKGFLYVTSLKRIIYLAMSISYNFISCAKWKCIASCLKFGFEEIFIDRESLMINMKKSSDLNVTDHFLCINSLSQHIMLCCQGSNFPHPATESRISVLMSLSPIK